LIEPRVTEKTISNNSSRRNTINDSNIENARQVMANEEVW